jgi:multidrug resistance protein, MATE family
MNGAFRGFWTGIERPRTYMFIVLMMSCLDAFLNYTLIFGHFALPALGVKGAAIGTVVSLYAGLVANVATALPRLRADGFSSLRPGISLLGRIVKLGVPATMQEFFFSAGYVAFFWMVGQVGTAELAAANVLVRVTLVLILLAMALGMASATLVSKTVGQGDLTAATEWGWDAGKLGVILITLLGVPLFVFPERFLSFFLSDPHTVGIAVTPLRLVAATTGLGSLIYIFAYILYSLGDGNRVTLVSFSTQWLFFLPVVWIVGPHLRHGLLHIWLVQIAYGTLATVLVTAIWMSGRWKRISI